MKLLIIKNGHTTTIEANAQDMLNTMKILAMQSGAQDVDGLNHRELTGHLHKLNPDTTYFLRHETDKMQSVQDFVEKFYPNYHNSQDIAKEADLDMACNNPDEVIKGSCAHSLLFHYTQEEPGNNQLKIDWQEAWIGILEKAIEASIEANNNIHSLEN